MIVVSNGLTSLLRNKIQVAKIRKGIIKIDISLLTDNTATIASDTRFISGHTRPRIAV